jgi:GTP cyclohydrolase I
MGFNVNPNKFDGPIQPKSNINTQSVSLLVNGKEVIVSYSRLKKIVRGLSKMAYLTGETNNEEEYQEEVAEDIFEALKLLEKKDKKKKKKR